METESILTVLTPNMNHDRFEHDVTSSQHGHEYPVRELRVLLWDYLMSLSRYLDPYPVLFHGVSVSQ